MMIFYKNQIFSLVAGIVLVTLIGCSKESPSPNKGSQIPPKKPAVAMPGTVPQGAKTPPSSAVSPVKLASPGTAVPQVKSMVPATAVPATVAGKKNDQPGKGPVSAINPEPAKTPALSSTTPAPEMSPKSSLTTASSGSAPFSNKAAMQAALSYKRPEYDSEGRKDPFIPYYMLEDTKGRKSSFPLLNYNLEELKLTVIIKIGKQRYYAMMQTPDGKGYTVKVGMEIGLAHGKIKEITDQTVKVEEEIQEDNEKKKREVIFSLHSPEEGKS